MRTGCRFPAVASGFALLAFLSVHAADPVLAQGTSCAPSRFDLTHTLDDPAADGPTAGDVAHFVAELCHGSGGVNDCWIFDRPPTLLDYLPGSLRCSAPVQMQVCEVGSGELRALAPIPLGSCMRIEFDARLTATPVFGVCHQAYSLMGASNVDCVPDGSASVFGSSTLDDGRPIAFPRLPGEPVDLTVRLHNYGDAYGHAATVQIDLDDPILERTLFDPVAVPSQVSVEPGPARILWSSSTGQLRVDFDEPLPPSVEQTVSIVGLRAGAEGTLCRSAVVIDWMDPVGSATIDEENLAPQTCLTVASAPGCAGVPAVVTGLLAAPAGADVALAWNPATDPATVAYNVWKVVTGDRALIPVADRQTSLARPLEVQAACVGVPVGREICLDLGDESVPTAPLVFYQIRGACPDWTEGP